MSIADEHFERGVKAYKAEDYDAAEEAFLKVLEIEPHSSDATMNLGNVYYRKDNLQKAQEFWLKAVTINPLEKKGYLNLGNLFYGQQAYSRAIYYWETYRSLDKDNADVCLNLGLAYEALSQMDEAYKNYHRYLTNNPNTPQAVNLKNRMAEAHKITDHNFQQAEKFMRAGVLSKAKEAYELCVSTYPLPGKGYQHYAAVLYQLGEYAEAARWYEAAHKKLPHESSVLINLGIAYEKLNDPFQALWAYGMALHVEKGNAFLKIKNRHVTLWEEQGPALLQAALEKARGLMEATRYEDAEKLAYRCRDIARELAEDQVAQVDELLTFLKERKDPKKQAAGIAYTLAEEYRTSGQYERALAFYDRYLEIMPDGEHAQEVRDKQEQMKKVISAVINSLLTMDKPSESVA